MDPNISNTMDPTTTTTTTTGDKRLVEPSAQHTNVSHNLTTIQKIQHLQTVGNITATNVSTIQSGQNVVTTTVAPPCNTIVGDSIALDINQKLPFIKSVVQAAASSTPGERGKITTLCGVGPSVRIISPSMLGNVERQASIQGQGQQQIQSGQQVVTTISTTYHVPRGPAAVANISAPRSTVATPIVRAAGPPVLPISRPGTSIPVSNPQWAAKTSVVYAQPQRHPVPPVSRIATRPPTVYTAQPARLVAPAQTRPVQATVVATVTTGAPSRLLTPVLQSNNAITRIPVPQVRPTGPQVTSPTVQPIRHQPQTIQTNPTVRTLSVTPTTNRVTVAAPVVGTASRITTGTAVTVQPTALGRQLSLNSTAGPTQGTFSRVVIPTQAVQSSQNHPTGNTRVVQAVQTITSLANIGGVSRVIATTSNSSNQRLTSQQTQATPVARITGMTLHSLTTTNRPPQQQQQQTTTTTTTTTVKPITGQTMAHTVQLKPGNQQTTTLRVASATNLPAQINIPTTTVVQPPTAATIIINNTNNINNNSPTQVSQSPSIFAQYRQVPVSSTPPMRISSSTYLVESSGNDQESHGKPNASPRPSILRKREYDGSPAKSIAKNLVPVLTSLAASSVVISSPPSSPRRERESGNQSSGSTTVSATSSPGLDDEPEQSRIIINQTMEMSPRKKPRKQQLTGVELTEARCTDEEMQFITEDKLRRDFIKDDIKDKYCISRKINLNSQHDGARNQTVVVRPRPTPSLLGSSWKNRCSGRVHHYRRPSDVRPREERRPTVAEIAQQKYVLQKINGWKVYQLTAQMEDLAELEKQVHEKLKTTLSMLESQQPSKIRQDDGLERVNELIKGNMQRSSLISEGMSEARTQLITIFQHKNHVNDILQRCGTKRTQKKRDK